MNFANAIAGGARGGFGKVASSSLFGTISGSAVANVMVDGWPTIPMMKRRPRSQALSFVATHRNNTEERVRRQAAIPHLLNCLTAAVE